MKKSILATLISLLGIMIFSGCAYGIRVDGPYEGRIIDADTKQAVEGVVVLGTWSRQIITPGGATHNFYDAQETVTDSNGDFTIQGLGVLALSNIIPMDVLIFKAGYKYLGSWSWEGSVKRELGKRQNITWEGSRAIIPLRKLTMEERRRQGDPPDPPSEASFHKVKLMLKEINKDRIERGFRPRQIWRGEEL